jgi:CHAT domain-containing protein/tetratricopeptide (TPR) repeat protein
MRAVGRALALPVLFSCLAPAAALGQDGATPPPERELKGNEPQTHTVELRAGQRLHIVVEQRGIDVVLALRGPGDAPLLEVDGVTGALGTEELLWEAAESGDHLLQVRARESVTNPGRYVLRLETAPAANERDRVWMAAQRLFIEARQAQQEATHPGWERAGVAFDAALSKWREAGDAVWEAATLLNLGAVRLRLNQVQPARQALESALVLQRRLGDRRGEASTLSNLGNVFSALEQQESARAYYEQALAIRREIQDRVGEAGTLTNLCNVYKAEGQYERARDCYERAIELHRALKSRRAELVTLGNLGSVYAELEDFEHARDYYEQALAISLEVGDRRRQAQMLASLGIVHEGRREYTQAQEQYERALVLARQVQDRGAEALGLGNLGNTYVQLAQYDKARDVYTQALALYRELGERSGEAMALGNLGVVYKNLKDPDLARRHLEQSMAIWREIRGKKDEAVDLYQLAVLARDRGDLEGARTHAEAALAIVESVRSDVGAHDLRSSFFATVQDYFALSVDILMQLHRGAPKAGHDAAALEVAERARARGLLDLLAEAGANIREGADPELVARELSVQKRLNAAAAAQRELLSHTHTPEESTASERQVAALTGEYQEVQAQIRRASPRYAALLQPQPLTLAEMQAQLDPDTVMLVYWLGAAGGARGYVWAVTPGSLASFEVPGRDAVEAATRRFRKTLASSSPAEADDTAAGDDLSRMLLSPVAAELGGKRLIVIADGALQYVPFAALPAPGTDRPPLGVEHEIVYEPSASSLAVLRRELAGRPPAPRMVAVLADPVFDAGDDRMDVARAARPKAAALASATPPPPLLSPELARALRGVRGDGAVLSRLPFARREAEAIAAAAAPDRALMALDFQASRQTASSDELSHYRIVHFATHGLLDAARPELSGLVLSLVDSQGQAQDGFLRLHDIYNLRLPADLVVLSACQTGLGPEVRGEGLVGLTRGFMYAGAARVVASLWQVDDAATAELMRRFYASLLKDGERPARALHQAQVAMWREGTWRSPYYWAGFVLQGEWR